MTGKEPSPHRTRFAAEARAERPDLSLLCNLIAAEHDPGFDEMAVAATETWLERLAGEVADEVAGTADPRRAREPDPAYWAAALRRVLGAGHRFHGTRSDFARLESSLLPAVLRRGRGLPILLAVVWLEVARRAGVPVYGMALPGHFMVGVGEPDGPHLLVDPFNGGAEVTEEEASTLVAQATSAPPAPVRHTAAQPLDIVARVLENIRAWAAERPEQSAVGLWAIDLLLLLPRHPARLRLDRARLLVERGEFECGAAELESYAETVAQFDEPAAEELRRQARSARALLN